MVDFKGGAKEAAKILQALDPQHRERLFQLIQAKDPKMAQLLEEYLITLDDLQYMTPKMLSEFLREVEMIDLGQALRICGGPIKDYFLNNLPSRLRRDLEEVLLGKPIPARDAQASYQKIMDVVKRKVERGELILRPEADPIV